MKAGLARPGIGHFHDFFGLRSRVSLSGWLVMLAASVFVLLLWSGFLGRLSEGAGRIEQVWEDRVSTWFEPTREREELVFLGIDEWSMSLADVGEEELAASPVLGMMGESWPWNRGIYAEVIDQLAEAGARVIIVDIVFPGPSLDVEADRLLAEAIARHRDKIVLAAHWAPIGEHAFAFGFPYDLFVRGEDGETAVGYVNFWNDDRDGLLRHAQYRISAGEVNGVDRHRDEPVYDSLAMAVGHKLGAVPPADECRVRFAVGEENDQRTAGAAYAPRSLYTIFTDYWSDPDGYDEGRFFEGKTVMIGPAAKLLHDEFPTPSGVVYGAQMHLQAIGCMLEGAYWKTMPRWIEFVIVASMCLVGMALVYVIRNPLMVLGALMALAVLYGGGCAMLANGSGFFPGILFVGAFGMLGLVMVTVSGEAAEFLIERRERVRLHQQFRRSVSPDVADAMVREPDGYFDAARGGRRQVVVLFSDVRGFTARSERMEPEALVKQLNEYFSVMVDVVFASGGTIDKFIGDAVMAIWGGLEDQEERAMARQALDAALGMDEALRKLNGWWEGEGLERFDIGIGIHLGDAVVGEIGSTERSDFTAIGDAVNVASRVEGMTKTLGAPILVTGKVAEALGEPAGLCFLGSFRVKGRQEGLEVYTHCSGATVEWDQAVAAIGRGEFAKADGLLAGLPKDHSLAGTARYYRGLLAGWKKSPPPDWDGIVTLESK